MIRWLPYFIDFKNTYFSLQSGATEMSLLYCWEIVQIMRLRKQSMARAQRNKIDYALWVKGMAYSLFLLNHSDTS